MDGSSLVGMCRGEGRQGGQGGRRPDRTDRLDHGHPDLSASPAAAPLPATGITVTDLSIGDSVVSTVTNGTGKFTLGNVPVGIHSLRFSGTGWVTLQVDGVSVLAARTSVVDGAVTALNPLVVVPNVSAAPAGFGAPAALAVAVTGGTGP